MEFEKNIKSKLLMRGFTQKQILNNRGLISAVIDETILLQTKNLILCEVSRSKPIKEDFIYNVSDQHIYIEQMNKGRLQDIDRYLDLTQTVEDKTIG
jgi:hypothetical protein